MVLRQVLRCSSGDYSWQVDLSRRRWQVTKSVRMVFNYILDYVKG